MKGFSVAVKKACNRSLPNSLKPSPSPLTPSRKMNNKNKTVTAFWRRESEPEGSGTARAGFVITWGLETRGVGRCDPIKKPRDSGDSLTVWQGSEALCHRVSGDKTGKSSAGSGDLDTKASSPNSRSRKRRSSQAIGVEPAHGRKHVFENVRVLRLDFIEELPQGATHRSGAVRADAGRDRHAALFGEGGGHLFGDEHKRPDQAKVL